MTAKPQPADKCPCGHHLIVVNSRREGLKRVRYIGCRKCGHRPDNNASVVPLDVAMGRMRFRSQPC